MDETLEILRDKALGKRGCAFHRESEAARDARNMLQSIPQEAAKHVPTEAPRRHARAAAPSHSSSLEPVVNTRRPRDGRYNDDAKYGQLTRFESGGGHWAFQHVAVEADIGLGLSTPEKRAAGLLEAPAASGAHRGSPADMQQRGEVVLGDNVAPPMDPEWAPAGMSGSDADPSPQRPHRRSMSADAAGASSWKKLTKLHWLLGQVLDGEEAQEALQAAFPAHAPPAFHFAPTSPLSPQFNPGVENRGMNVTGTAAEPGHAGEGALFPGGPAASPPRKRKRRWQRPGKSTQAKGQRNPLAARQGETMRDFARRMPPAGKAPGSTRIRSTASLVRGVGADPLALGQQRFWGSPQDGWGLSAWDALQWRHRALAWTVELPPPRVTCRAYRRAVRLYLQIIGMPHVLGVLQAPGSVPARLASRLQGLHRQLVDDACVPFTWQVPTIL